MDPLNPRDQQPPEPERRARRKQADQPPKTPAPSSRYKRPGAKGARAGARSDLAARSASHADAATDRLSAFAHEIASLLEGAMRLVTLSRTGVETSALVTDPGACAEVSRRLSAASSALERISELVHASMRPCAGPAGATPSGERSLRDAFEHAVDVLRPLADERGVRLETDLADSLRGAPAGALHSVVLSGLRNAIEASGPGGRAVLRAGVTPRPEGVSELHAEITDEGVGLPPDAEDRVFEHGYSTKPGGLGVGLALSREILREMGGTIDISTRMDGTRRRGASLVFRCPLPKRAED